VPLATAAMERSPASSHPAAQIVYGTLPPVVADRKPVHEETAATFEEAPLPHAPLDAALPELPRRHLVSDARDTSTSLPARFGARERRGDPVELPSVTPARLQQRPALSPSPPRPDQTDDRLELASRLAHAGRARVAYNRFEHGDTPSGIGQTTTRVGELARQARTESRRLAPLKSSVAADEHFRPLPDPNRGDLWRHARDSAAHVSNAVGLVSRPEHAELVADHLADIVGDAPIGPAAHHSDDHRRALAACVHVTGAALELAHARDAAEHGVLSKAAYHLARGRARSLLDAHGLGDNEHVKNAFEADDDPKARKDLRDRLDVAHGRAHLAYVKAVRAHQSQTDPDDEP
jgi:hypothetical protein